MTAVNSAKVKWITARQWNTNKIHAEILNERLRLVAVPHPVQMQGG